MLVFYKMEIFLQSKMGVQKGIVKTQILLETLAAWILSLRWPRKLSSALRWNIEEILLHLVKLLSDDIMNESLDQELSVKGDRKEVRSIFSK